MLRPTIIAQSYASHNSAADELKMFPIGATVEAFYSAEHPDKAFLLSESSAAPVVFIVVGILSPIIRWGREGKERVEKEMGT